MKKKAPQLKSEAWLLRGISSIPGWLTLTEGRLSFEAAGPGSAWPWQLRKLERDAHRPGLAKAIDAGTEVVVFDLPLASVQVRFPWYYFAGGVKLACAGARYRISFGTPANMRLPADRTDVLDVVAVAAEQFEEARTMRVSGKTWKAALTPEREGG